MKNLLRSIVVAMLVLLCGVNASAQFRFGIRAGMTINKLQLNDLPATVSSDNRCGFTAGVMTEFTVPIIGICLDASLMYSRMNSRVSVPESAASFTKSSKDFFQIPVNIKYKLGLPVVGKIIAPYIYTGPNFAFRLGHSDAFKTFQVAWDLGVGVELIRHLQIGAGYSWGINNIAKSLTGNEHFNGDFKTKNNYWTITAAYIF